MKNGKFIGKALGYGGEIEIKVGVENNAITNIEVVSHKETKIISDPAFKYVIENILKENTICVPNVSGCSVTSMALKRAVGEGLIAAGAEKEKIDMLITESEVLEKIVVGMRKKKLKPEYDVIIVGSGGAGLSAAISAKENGASVLVLEKRNTFGGNTLVSMGGVNIPCNTAQIDTGVIDSKELYYNDIIKGGDNESLKEQVEILVENALDTYNWIKDTVGVEFKEKTLIHFGGHTVSRAAVFAGKYAIELITKLRSKAEELGVDIVSGVKVEDLIYENNRVVGIKTTNEIIKANFGVILATGGFGGNVEMRMKYDPSLDERYKTTNVSGIVGEGHIMAEKLNAKFVHMNYIQTFPIANPLTGELSHVGGSRFDGAILVNKEGKRFVEELERRDVVSEGVLNQTGGLAYLVWSKEIESINNNISHNLSEVEKGKRDGIFVEGDTLEEAGKAIGLNVESLKETVMRYNEFVKNGKDEDFNRRGNLVSIEEGPFYIQGVVPAVHHTMGGLSINNKNQVISNEDEIIKGLYAAGEIVGGTHGTNRLGGNAITEILVFGKLAGENIVKNK